MIFLIELLIYLLFNLSFTTDSFVILLKTAKVIPIYKKESKLDCAKILDKLMHNRLYNVLNDNKIIYPLNFHFRQKYSTSLILIHITQTIKETFDQRRYGCGIFVDLQNVFDSVNRNILMGKFRHYDNAGVAYSLF